MPELIVVIFSMGLPDDDQPIAALPFSDPITEGLPEHSRLGRNLEERLAATGIPTGWPGAASGGRPCERPYNGHVPGARIQSVKRQLWALVQFLQQCVGSGLRLIVLVHAVVYFPR